MRTRLLAATLVILGTLAFTTLPHAQTTSNGPYYAIPSWDQTLPSATRFIVLSNFGSNAVLDRETGLVWEKSPDTTAQNWQDAQFHCNRQSVGGRLGWRLPTIQELTSLIDPAVPLPGPTLPVGHPFSNVQSSQYWSAATHPTLVAFAWDVTFENGHVGTTDKSLTLFVWCVRGGQGVDPR